MSEATAQAMRDNDQSVQDAIGLDDGVKETLDRAAGQAAQQLSDAADQLQSITPGAADSALNLTDSLQSSCLQAVVYFSTDSSLWQKLLATSDLTCHSVPTI